jgi:DNA invertase Pin-like site-specific DNA recombinase
VRVIGYLRVSTVDQAERGYGLDAQRFAIQAEVDRRGWEVTWVEDAGRSGRDINRPGISAALAALKRREYDGLVVSKLDRLSRSLKDFSDVLERAERQGWAVVTLDLGIDTTTPTGELLANIMAAVSRWERRMIGQRTREGLAAARSKGVRLGGPIKLDPEIAQRIRASRLTGCSLRAIAGSLNDDNVPCANGGLRWHASSVKSVVDRLTQPGPSNAEPHDATPDRFHDRFSVDAADLRVLKEPTATSPRKDQEPAGANVVDIEGNYANCREEPE